MNNGFRLFGRCHGNSRKFHFPIEGAYAALEIKASLDLKSLDDAMENL